jgi:hypothetical protein
VKNTSVMSTTGAAHISTIVALLLAAPFMAQGAVNVTGLVSALAISATVVDSCLSRRPAPWSLLTPQWPNVLTCIAACSRGAAVMVLTAPLATWLLFIVPA